MAMPYARSTSAMDAPTRRGATHASDYLNDIFQQRLASWNRRRLEPTVPCADWQAQFASDMRMLHAERCFIEALRDEVRDEAALVPTDVDGFIAWFEALEQSGPGQHDPLFGWLADMASRDDLRWYLEQEAAGEAGFDDLVAMTQVKLPPLPKLELARNYWDEMGKGNIKGMHGPMLDKLVDILELRPDIRRTCWQSLALANAMTAMASIRSYAWHSVGALGVVELTAPDRSAHVARGLRRIGLSPKQSVYFDLHAVLDVKHSEDWNREALRPAIAEDPARATAIAEGALIRLRAGARCFERYRSHFGLG